MDETLLKYTNLIMDLHEFMAEGKGDDDEADEIREQLMDMQNEKEFPSYADDLSGDLYMLVEEDMYFALPEGDSKEEYRLWLDSAVKASRWTEVLELLKCSLNIERDLIAEYRGKAWRALGNDRAADKFLTYARKLQKEV